MSRYRQLDVAVDGGLLHAGVWGDDGAPTVLAVHGITATHRAWGWLADALPDVRVVAPDLRGRGRSNRLPGPFGMARHADDLAALLDHLGTGPVVVVGHSMGGFASVVLAHRRPDVVTSLVLVDGGLPLEVPAGADPDTLMRAVLGPAAARLAMTFQDERAYHDFWRAHPAFVGEFDGPSVPDRLDRAAAADATDGADAADATDGAGAADATDDDLRGYFDYDLEPADGGGLRPTSRLEAVTGDQRELVTGASLLPALDALSAPALFLRAPRGLLDGDPLYDAGHVERWAAQLPSLRTAEVPGVNHYTIIMGTAGAGAVAQHVSHQLEGARR